MIEKNRLEELIEQMADIFVVMHFGVYTHKLTREYKLGDYGVGVVKYGKVSERWAYEDLFETKEDAEEYAEFGNITRTERLELPSWEEFANGKVVEFVSNKLLYELKKCGERIYISYRTYIDDSIWEIIFEKPLVKENYDEARRLCVKLFKGEEV